MSVHHSIKDDMFTLTIEASFETDTFVDALEEGMRDRAFRAPMRALIDARRVEAAPADPLPGREARIYAEIGHCFIPHWALVAPSDWLLFSLARMICTITDLRGVHMRAYDDIDEARCRLTWSNFHQQEPFCRVAASCRPRFTRPSRNA